MDRVYFDYNSTTPLREEVKALMLSMPFLPYNASSTHYYGRKSKEILNNQRSKLLGILDADSDTYKLVFTSSGTEANNLALKGITDRVITSKIEHMSISKIASGMNSARILVDQNGVVNIENYVETLINSPHSLVSVVYANNETGVIQDIKLSSSLAHQYDCLMHIDASQALGKIPFSVDDLDVDLITISSHKIGGPFGAAALIYRKNIELTPTIVGGGQEYNLRAGTENLMSIVGFTKATELAIEEIEQYTQYTSTLRDFIEAEIAAISEQTIFFSKKADRLPNTSYFNMPGVSSQTQIVNFDLAGFCVSAGSACSSGKNTESKIIYNMGFDQKIASTAIRISLGPANSQSQAECFIQKWAELYNKLSLTQNAA